MEGNTGYPEEDGGNQKSKFSSAANVGQKE
jgi:hypothetical protein